MADVVQLNTKPPPSGPPEDKPEYVWTCGQCDGQSFQLLSTGIICCCRCAWRSDCAQDHAETHWRSHLPELPLNFADIPPLSIENVITEHKPTPLILRSFAKALTSEDPVAVLIVRREGGMRMWSEGCGSEEQREWFRERVQSFSNFLLRLDAEPEEPSGA